MKKFIVPLLPILLVGCTTGINQSTASINGTYYLIEKPTYTLFGLKQWSGTPVWTNLDREHKDYIYDLLQQCRNALPNNASGKQFYSCITQKLYH